MNEKQHIVLYSGGFDSTVLLLSLLRDIDSSQIIALNIQYAQRNFPEIFVAKDICKKFNVTYHELDISPISKEIFRLSSLVNKRKNIDISLLKNKQPNTYVPNRNLVFLSIALAYAENIGAHFVYTAIQPHHKYYYWDATSDFVNQLNKLIELNPYNIKVKAPFKNMHKKEIYKYALDLGLDKSILEKTWSCYNPLKIINEKYVEYKPCGKCGSCQERKEFLPQKSLKILKGEENEFETNI